MHDQTIGEAEKASCIWPFETAAMKRARSIWIARIEPQRFAKESRRGNRYRARRLRLGPGDNAGWAFANLERCCNGQVLRCPGLCAVARAGTPCPRQAPKPAHRRVAAAPAISFAGKQIFDRHAERLSVQEAISRPPGFDMSSSRRHGVLGCPVNSNVALPKFASRRSLHRASREAWRDARTPGKSGTIPGGTPTISFKCVCSWSHSSLS